MLSILSTYFSESFNIGFIGSFTSSIYGFVPTLELSSPFDDSFERSEKVYLTP